MKRASGYILAGFIKQEAGPPKHFLGCPAGEGKKQQVFRQYILVYKIGNSIHQGACFTATSPGNYKQGAIPMGYCFILGGVKIPSDVDSFTFRFPAVRP